MDEKTFEDYALELGIKGQVVRDFDDTMCALDFAWELTRALHSAGKTDDTVFVRYSEDMDEEEEYVFLLVSVKGGWER